MLTDNDIFFSETDRQALIDSVAEGDSYRIRGIIFNLKNGAKLKVLNLAKFYQNFK